MAVVFSFPDVDEDPVADAVLQAARETVLAFGVRRTTLTEVARRSGRSRPTIYTRWPDVRSLIGDLLTREMRAVISATEQVEQGSASAREFLVDRLVAIASAFRENPLLRKIIEVDPELLLPYILQRLGTSQRIALEVIESWIIAGQEDGSIKAGDVAAHARMVLLATQSAVLSGPMVADRLPAGELASELGVLVDRYLRP